MAVGVVDSEIHIVGGINNLINGKEKASHLIYQPESDIWSDSEPLPFPLDHLGGAVIDNQFYVFGGRFSGSNVAHTLLWVKETSSWQSLAQLNSARSGSGVTVHNNNIYVVGGENELTQKTISSVERYDVNSGEWQAMLDIPRANYGSAVSAYANTLYVFGGSPKSGFDRSSTVLKLAM
jgi:N-acetylneuraminic acid mutarotase